MPSVDVRAVGAGAALALLVGVPAVLAFRVLDLVADVGCDSNWAFLFFVPIVVGWVVGGLVAARRRPEAPFTHGLLAALVGFAVLALIRLAVTAAADESRSCAGSAAYLFNAMLATSAGIFGALIATRRRRPVPRAGDRP